MRAGIYFRVSSDEQVDGFSLDAQRRALTDFCRAKDWAVAGEYADGKLTFTLTTPEGGMTINFKAALKEDGTIAGSLDMQGNEGPWTATRVKGY